MFTGPLGLVEAFCLLTRSCFGEYYTVIVEPCGMRTNMLLNKCTYITELTRGRLTTI